MDSERWQEIKGILNRLDEVSPAARRPILDELGRGDPALRREVEDYLPYDAECFIDEPLWDLMPEEQATDIGGLLPQARRVEDSEAATSDETRIGPYRIQKLLGRGGMGQVHLAVREDDYEQKVAIKRILGPLAHGEMHTRFTNERQILANLQHPGIARLLDGGTDDDGLPYLVMEFVEGETIDAYCKRHSLNLRQRLRLFRKVCQVVHYAHQNLIVHRDLKPGNIMVTPEGKPRLLDFGIAKLLEGSRDGQVTAEGRVPLTPACASPEQVMGEPITTASDIYALGLLLYELLAGRKPYDVNGLDFSALIRQICLKEPPPPSQALGTDPNSDDLDVTESTRYESDPLPPAPPACEPPEDPPTYKSLKALARKRRLLAGDLDAIVMKAIRKEPEHRYLSAADLADDVLNYLEGRPVNARKGNWFYHTSKFLRRNRPALAVLLLIIASALTSTVMWRSAVSSREHAENQRIVAEQREAEAVAAQENFRALDDFLLSIFLSADPDESRGELLTVKEVIAKGRRDIEDTLAGQPGIAAEMYYRFGRIYYSLGDREEALEMSRQALAKFREASPGAGPDHADHIANVGKGHYGLSDYHAAERYYRQAMSMRRSLGLPEREYIFTIGNLASSQLKLGKYKAAEESYRKIVELLSQDSQGQDEEIGWAFHGLGTFYKTTESYEKAVESLQRALEYRLKGDDPQTTAIASTRSALGEAFLHLGRYEEAQQELRLALEVRVVRQAGTKQESTNRRLLALALLRAGEPEAAQAQVDRALEILGRIVPPGHRLIASAQAVKAEILLSQGELENAELLLLQGLEALRAQSDSRAPTLRYSLRTLIRLYETSGRQEDAWKYKAELSSLQTPVG